MPAKKSQYPKHLFVLEVSIRGRLFQHNHPTQDSAMGEFRAMNRDMQDARGVIQRLAVWHNNKLIITAVPNPPKPLPEPDMYGVRRIPEQGRVRERQFQAALARKAKAALPVQPSESVKDLMI